MNMTELAQRLKRFRLQRGLTLEEVASQAGLSRGWLSKVENFRATPSLPALSEIVRVLGIPLSELFEGLDTRMPLAVVRADERIEFRRDEEVSLIKYQSLAHSRPGRQMDPFELTIPPEDTRPQLTHSGEEFLYVLDGRVRLEYGERSEELNPGDSVYFDGEEPHRVVCLEGDRPARVLVVYYGTDSDGLLQNGNDSSEPDTDS